LSGQLRLLIMSATGRDIQSGGCLPHRFFFNALSGSFKKIIQNQIKNTGNIGCVFFLKRAAQFLQRFLPAPKCKARIENSLFGSGKAVSEGIAYRSVQ